MGHEPFTAADGCAITMLGMVALSMGVLLSLGICMARNAARRDPAVDALLEELEAAEKQERLATTASPSAPPPEPWEKPADWWKS